MGRMRESMTNHPESWFGALIGATILCVVLAGLAAINGSLVPAMMLLAAAWGHALVAMRVIEGAARG